ncbi:serine/threonine protein kinase [Gloeocapsopsis crepidinum LEGE 06123]|uniref:Serine/threonine protein kinase n=1 Tax=Gloeocapsopsis crepidinum LEGE 06123 TaxID=588587 RepID=A0ABR9ULV2_9CHRO|nr:serine/threonine-protein kinase [Gloeocapsopsis crepidinum]MBE9189255.1 serine/threonine protein kinase [Gloeocapsopsis crepidinum LEGE 06123]
MLQCGQLLQGRYQLQEKLKNSRSKQTWLAVDCTHQTTCVIVKVLFFSNVTEWEELKLFERQAQVLQQISHPQIPQYRDVFWLEAQSPAYVLVQEYIPGVSLQQWQQQCLSESQIRQIATQVLHILIYLHELHPPVIHRDIKPSNLIWSNDEKVYLVDFGAVQNQDTYLGETFTVVGTCGYTPLEQFGGKAVAASDLYALGATLIHLLTGTSPADLPQYNLHFQFAELVNCSPSLLSWLQKMTEPVTEKRFGCARQALAALESGIIVNTAVVNHSGKGGLFDASIGVPEEIQGWNWGAFLLAPFWLISNRVWIGLLSWVPLVGFWMAIALGAKGNEWAWKSRRWQSIEHFQQHQKRWAIAGIISGIAVNLVFWHLGILFLASMLL